jgi:hypothetical protein
MDTPDDEQVDIKVEGPGPLPFLTSDEVRAGTYLGHPNAPAESYYAYPLQTLPQVSQPQPFAPTNVPSSPFPQPFAPTNVHSPSPQLFAPTNVHSPSPTPSPAQAQTQPEVSQTGQKLFAPTNNFGSLPDAYTYKYPQPGWGGSPQPYSQPVHVGQFSPTSPLHSTAQSLQSQIPRGLQGYVSPQTGESQPSSFHGAFNRPPSSFQDTSLPQKRPFPASAGHSSNASRATTPRNADNATIGDFFSQTRDPFPRTRAYLAATRGYNFNVTTPNNTNFVMGNHALASQNQALPTNVAVQNRQHLMDTQLMPPPRSTQPLRDPQPNTQPTQGPPTQQWRTDNLQRK